MGVGDSQEASFTLRAGIPAGTWRLVGDGMAVEPVDVRFEILWRSAAGDVSIVTFQHHFDPPAILDTAIPYEETMEGPAVDADEGDLLILRYSALNATVDSAYVPNGDGIRNNGRIPFIELPQ